MAEIIIIGGGIGGLALALGLHRLGIPFRVFEQAPRLEEVGAGLGVWRNALYALDALGVGEQVRTLGCPIRAGAFCSDQGEVLSHVDLGDILPPGPEPLHIMRRADLHNILAAQLPSDRIVLGAKCVSIQQDSQQVVVNFENIDSVTGQVLVGADGVRSVVRTHLWGETPLRYSGQTCYRGIAELDVSTIKVLREIQGKGQRGSVCPLSADRAYWWAACNAPQNQLVAPNQRREHLLKLYKGWPFQLYEIIAATPSEQILQNDLVDRVSLTSWQKGRATLLGDAAHPMLPNLGQGACSAIEDGVVLARCLAQTSDVVKALQIYEQARIPRTTALVKDSWDFGRLVLWEHPWAVKLREKLLKYIPKSLVKKRLIEQANYQVGKLL